MGNDREEHVFALTQSLELYDTYQAKMLDCDRKLEVLVAALSPKTEKPVGKLSRARIKTKQVNAPTFDVRAALYPVVGVDLTEIHGLGPSLELKLIGECGADLKAWPSSKHQALHLLALPRAWQQDLWWQGTVLAYTEVLQSSSRAVAAGSHYGSAKRYGARGILSSAVLTRWQGDGRDGDRSQDRSPILQHPSARDELQGSAWIPSLPLQLKRVRDSGSIRTLAVPLQPAIARSLRTLTDKEGTLPYQRW